MTPKLKMRSMKLSDLTPAEYNPRKDLQPGDAEYEKLKRSIEEFGLVDPLIYNDRTETLVGGHQRLKVMRDLGITETDVSVVDLDEADEKALNVALNKISGDWELEALSTLFKDLEIEGYDLELTGFDTKEIDALLNLGTDEVDEDEAPEPPKDPVSQEGDLWILGRHRLLCGDSTSPDATGKLMDGAQADLVLTDPPYNVDYEGGTKDKLKISNDKMSDQDFLDFLVAAFTRMHEHSKEGASFYVFHADSEGYNFRAGLKLAGYHIRQCLIWQKNSLVMGRQDYQWMHEPILYGWKEGASHSWYSDRKQTTIVRWDKPQRNTDHPTMKPVGLCAYFLGNNTKKGDIVIDFFGGSGSTLMACEQTGRSCYTMELDPRYVDVIVKRYLNWCEDQGIESDVRLLRGGETLTWEALQNED